MIVKRRGAMTRLLVYNSECHLDAPAVAVLTTDFFNQKIVEGHRVLARRYINIIKRMKNICTIIVSLENAKLKDIVNFNELSPKQYEWFIFTLKVMEKIKSWKNVKAIHIMSFNNFYPLILSKALGSNTWSSIIHIFYHPTAFRNIKYLPTKLLIKLRIPMGVLVSSVLMKKHLEEYLCLQPGHCYKNGAEYIHYIQPVVHENDHFLDHANLKKLRSKNVRSKYGISDDAIVITYMGHIVPHRGIFDLLKAFKIASEYNRRLRLLITHTNILFEDGKTSYTELLLRLINKYDLKDKVVIKGIMPYQEIYALTDFMFFGFDDTFYFTFPPLVICESIVAGVPFILRRSQIIDELVMVGILRKDDEIPIYNSINELIDILIEIEQHTNLNEFHRLMKRGREVFSANKVMNNLIKLYWNVLNQQF